MAFLYRNLMMMMIASDQDWEEEEGFFAEKTFLYVHEAKCVRLYNTICLYESIWILTL